MVRNLLASLGLALFAVAGCDDYFLTADLQGAPQVVYLNGEPDHCIVVPKARAEPQEMPAQSPAEPSLAHVR